MPPPIARGPRTNRARRPRPFAPTDRALGLARFAAVGLVARFGELSDGVMATGDLSGRETEGIHGPQEIGQRLRPALCPRRDIRRPAVGALRARAGQSGRDQAPFDWVG
jgi:hypothetical protein